MKRRPPHAGRSLWTEHALDGCGTIHRPALGFDAERRMSDVVARHTESGFTAQHRNIKGDHLSESVNKR